MGGVGAWRAGSAEFRAAGLDAATVVIYTTIRRGQYETREGRKTRSEAMAEFMLGELTTDLTATFGLGKSFRDRETSVIEAGTRVTNRWDDGGWHKFNCLECGRQATYAVRDASVLDTALGIEAAPPARVRAIAEIRRLMGLHGITAADLG
jgi:hypothetical protein